MVKRLFLLCVATIGLIACTDSIGPNRNVAESRPLTIPEYAAQLKGDPFLKGISGMLGRPGLSDAIDASLGLVDGSGSIDTRAAQSALASARFTLAEATDEESGTPLTENDVFGAVISVTIDRIAQLNSDTLAAPAAEPPPSR